MIPASKPSTGPRWAWKRLALILLAAATLFGISGCYCYPGYGGGGGGYGGGGYGYGGGGYGGGGGGGYCPAY